MDFSPFNHVVKCCLQGMQSEELGNAEEAHKFFLEAWSIATNDFEKYLAAYYLARQEKNSSQKLNWLELSLQFALKINDPATNSALPILYTHIANCYKALNNNNNAKINFEKASLHQHNPSDTGPFYHGTKANLNTGDLLSAGANSNYKSALKMNHIYFTALLNGAGLAAALAKGDGKERVYIVVPTGSFENDPNLTNKKFPGNPTRSYRSVLPLKIIGEIAEWQQQSAEAIQKFRDKLDENKGEIIN